MRKGLLTAGLFYMLTACNQSEQQTGNTNVSDTASHSAHNDHAGNNGTDKGQEGSMMSLMERNMEQMEKMRSLGSSDKDFAAMMKIHHMGAIEMARVQLANGTDEQVKAMAQRMIDDQQQEISALDAFLNNNNQNSAATDKRSPFYDKVMKEMDNLDMDDMEHSGSVDRQFLQMMIPHHQGGIAMADLYLKNGAQDQKLKAMAGKIKTEQQKEIQQMQGRLANLK
jgi:uncharacterized protein (DUF305 family)